MVSSIEHNKRFGSELQKVTNHLLLFGKAYQPTMKTSFTHLFTFALTTTTSSAFVAPRFGTCKSSSNTLFAKKDAADNANVPVSLHHYYTHLYRMST